MRDGNKLSQLIQQKSLLKILKNSQNNCQQLYLQLLALILVQSEMFIGYKRQV